MPNEDLDPWALVWFLYAALCFAFALCCLFGYRLARARRRIKELETENRDLSMIVDGELTILDGLRCTDHD